MKQRKSRGSCVPRLFACRYWCPFAGYLQIWNDQLQAGTERKQEALNRAAESVVLARQGEAMYEQGRLRGVGSSWGGKGRI